MRIVTNTPDLLVVRDRSVSGVVGVLIIAIVFGTLGTLATLHGDDAMTRMAGAGFAVLAVPLVGFALYIAAEHVHVFDRRRGLLLRRVRRLIGPREERTIPLDRIRGVELVVERETADPDTYGIDLLIASDLGGPPGRLSLRNYTSSTDLRPVLAVLERWLGR